MNNTKITACLLASAMLIGALGVFSTTASALEESICTCSKMCRNGVVDEGCSVCVQDATRCRIDTYWVEEGPNVYYQYNSEDEYVSTHHHFVEYKPLYESDLHEYYCSATDEYCPVFDSIGKVYTDDCTWSDGACILCRNICMHLTRALGVCVVCKDLEFDCSCDTACNVLSINQDCDFCSHDTGYYINCGAKSTNGEDDADDPPSLIEPDRIFCSCITKCSEGSINTTCQKCSTDLSSCNPRGGLVEKKCTCWKKCEKVGNPKCELCSPGGLALGLCNPTPCTHSLGENNICTICEAFVGTGSSLDSDNSDFGDIFGRPIASNSNIGGTLWIDSLGRDSLIFNWGYGESIDVSVFDLEFKAHESAIIVNHGQYQDDRHWMAFNLPDVLADGDRIIATRGLYGESKKTEYIFEQNENMPNNFVQESSQNTSFLSDYMMMYTYDYVYVDHATFNFELIPATLRFVITNTHSRALTVGSVSLRLVDSNGVVSSVASETVSLSVADIRDLTLEYSGSYDAITTNVSGATLNIGESYIAYAMVLPLNDIDAFLGKTLQVLVNTEYGASVVLEVSGEDIADANGLYGNDLYNWVGGKSYTFYVGTRCYDGCTLDAGSDCTLCGYCQHEYSNGICDICGIACEELGGHTYDNVCDAYCNICNLIREVNGHTYDNDCDPNCNVCNSARTPGDHKYGEGCADTNCDECGEERNAPGHDFSEWRTVNEATTDAEGVSQRVCNNCGKTETRTIDKLPTPAEPDNSYTTEESHTERETNWFIELWNAIVSFFRKLFAIKEN